MKIGLDLDGVIFNSEMFFLASGEIFDCRFLKRNSTKKPQEPRVQSKYAWTQQEIDAYVAKYSCDSSFDVMPCAAEVIKYLQEAGHEIIVISARGQFSKKEIEIAIEKLKKAAIHIDRFYWNQCNKTDICVQEKLDVMIDDRYDICQELSQYGILSIYFRLSGLQKIETSDDCIEVHNWGEIYRKLDELGYF